MTSPATNFKLGLFALAALAGSAIALLVLGLHAGRTPTTEFHTLFDESVQGLDVGAPVDFLGVRIGNIARIEIADDRRHIDVTLAIETRRSTQLRLLTRPSGVRTRLSIQGLTGVKFIDLDVAAPGEAGEPAPSSPLPPRYLPSRPSLAWEIEEQGARLGRSVRSLVDDAHVVLRRLDAALDDVHAQRIPEHLVAALDRAGAALDATRPVMPRATAVLRSVDKVSGELSELVELARRVLARLGADDGLAASAHRTSEAIGELGHRAIQSTGELDQTLREVGDAARMLRTFIEQLERDPEMLLKGRPPARRP